MVRIAAYLRLSKEDGGDFDKGESDSIGTQRDLVRAYVRKHFEDYELLEFQDDGYTGTNFNRPGVTALLEKAKAGAVDCIVVKDFSRFSRDYIELGTYIERVFPFMKIRFISVNDRYDSKDREGNGGMDVAFRHLLYDLYSKDLSVKVKSSLEARKRRGMYVSGNCPFGYEKAPADRHMLVIAEDEAKVVRRIFSMSAEGFTSSQIAKCFNEERVKTPIRFKMEKGRTSRMPRGEEFLWDKSMVCAILRNRVYAGDMVYGKYERQQVGGKNRQKPKEEWKIFPNHHEAIIEGELFEAAQRGGRLGKGNSGKEGFGREGFGKESFGRRRVKGKSHPLVGKMVCGCCGYRLVYRKGRNPYFYCSNRYTNGKDGCVGQVNAMFAVEAVLYRVQKERGEFLESAGLTVGNVEEIVEKAVEKIVAARGGEMESFWKEGAQHSDAR